MPGTKASVGVFVTPLGAEMDGQRRLVEVAGEAAVEIGVVGRGDLGLRLGPQRDAVGDLGRLGARLLDDRDRHRHVARLLPDDPLQREALGEGLGILHQMEDDAGAARGRRGERHRRHREGALAVRGPQRRLLGAGAAREHVDAVRHHEGRVEADAELADQARLLVALRRLDPLEEGPRAGAGDGAERLDHLVAAHADAVVLDGEGALLGIDRERDAGLGVFAEQRRLGDRLVAQLLVGVGGVRDQLAQEDGLVRIDGVHHEVQELRDIGFEYAAFGAGLVGASLIVNGHGGGFPAMLRRITRWRERCRGFKTLRSRRGGRSGG